MSKRVDLGLHEDFFVMRIPSSLRTALTRHAASRLMTVSSFARNALVAALERDGVHFRQPPRTKQREHSVA